MTAELTFVDTNVLLYAHDRSAGLKRDVAARLVADLWGSRHGVMSTQVLQEFYVNATRKLPHPLSAPKARDIISRYSTWPTHRIEPADVIAASVLEKRSRLSFWDALVVVSAGRLGATLLVSEDLQDGRTIAGVRIENPFVRG